MKYRDLQRRMNHDRSDDSESGGDSDHGHVGKKRKRSRKENEGKDNGEEEEQLDDIQRSAKKYCICYALFHHISRPRYVKILAEHDLPDDLDDYDASSRYNDDDTMLQGDAIDFAIAFGVDVVRQLAQSHILRSKVRCVELCLRRKGLIKTIGYARNDCRSH
jgi:hypothetical protein